MVSYVDDLVIFLYDVHGIEHLLGALKAFFQSNEPIVNVDKTKMMVVWTIQPHLHPMFIYKGEHVQFVQSVSIIINVLAKNKWSVFFESKLQSGWKILYVGK